MITSIWCLQALFKDNVWKQKSPENRGFFKYVFIKIIYNLPNKKRPG
jgi:hypothetical protein